MTLIPYTVVRSNRKSVALVIDCEAKLIVRAPYHVSEDVVEGFVRTKEHWIFEKQVQGAAFGVKHSSIVIDDCESIMYLGNVYTIIRSDVDTITIEGTILYIPQLITQADVITWMKEEAVKVLTERVLRYADLMGVSYQTIKLSEAKSRWGSCSAKNSLNFAWRLIMCPLSAIDYIVVHELSHIEYKNHGAAFWARVKTVLPNYKEQQDWLTLNRKLMDII